MDVLLALAEAAVREARENPRMLYRGPALFWRARGGQMVRLFTAGSDDGPLPNLSYQPSPKA